MPAFLQGLSAPVRLDFDYTPEQLARLVQVETDPLTRWESLQRLARTAMLPGEQREAARVALSATQAGLLDDAHADPAFVAECLTLPDVWDLSSDHVLIDLDALWRERETLLNALATQQAERLRWRYQELTGPASGGLDGASAGARRLRNLCLGRLARIELDGVRAARHFHAAHVLTDRLAGLRTLVHRGLPQADAVLRAFAHTHQQDALTTDRWLAIVATTPRPGVLDTVAVLLGSRHWQPTNPNRVRAILAAFARNNIPAFHRPDGAGYELFFSRIAELDAINPQVASRHLALLENWHRLDPARRDQLATKLATLEPQLRSRDTRDMLERLRERG